MQCWSSFNSSSVFSLSLFLLLPCVTHPSFLLFFLSLFFCLMQFNSPSILIAFQIHTYAHTQECTATGGVGKVTGASGSEGEVRRAQVYILSPPQHSTLHTPLKHSLSFAPAQVTCVPKCIFRQVEGPLSFFPALSHSSQKLKFSQATSGVSHSLPSRLALPWYNQNKN